MSKGRVAPSVPYKPFLLADLRDPAFAASYLNEAAEDDHPGVFMLALRDLAEAYGGIGAIARRSGLNRQQLYKTLANGGNPEFRTLRAILEAAGFSLAVVPLARPAKRAAAPVRRRRLIETRARSLREERPAPVR